MPTSGIFGIPLISSQQATPEITHNEAIYLLQAVMAGAIEVGQNTPPGSPDEGDVYVLGAAPTGVWSGQENKVAIFVNGAWRFLPGVDSGGTDIPIGATHAGLRVFNQDDGLFYAWDGAAWTASADASDKVDRAGDTMTGPLVLLNAGSFPQLTIQHASQPAIMDFIGDGQAAGPRIFRHTNNNLAPNFVFYKTRGSAASPSIPNTNDFFFSLLGGLWDGSNFVVTSNIQGQLIASSPSSGDLESRLQFRCVPPASAAQAEIMRLDHASGLSMYGENTVITPNRLLRTRVFTVATLPVANIASGDTAIVTDANATTLGSVVAGGGSNRVRVNYDGTNWRIG